jgi:PAS domain S-box-containing protein
MRLINHKEEQLIISPVNIVIGQSDIGRELNSVADIELRLIEEKFYKIFNSNPLPMYISDLKSFNIIDVNDSFVKNMGIKNKENIIGKRVDDSGLKIIRKKDQDRVINDIITKGEIKNFLCRFKNANGKKLKGLFSGSLIELNDQKCLFLICQLVSKKCVFNIFKTFLFF